MPISKYWGGYLMTQQRNSIYNHLRLRYAAKSAYNIRCPLEYGLENMPGLVIWSSLIPPLPFLLLACLTDSAAVIWSDLAHINASSLFAIVYLSYGATLFGYGMWSVLLGKYTAAKVSPLSLLIPVIGLAIAQIILHESITGLQLAGCGIIMLGLIVSLLPQLW